MSENFHKIRAATGHKGHPPLAHRQFLLCGKGPNALETAQLRLEVAGCGSHLCVLSSHECLVGLLTKHFRRHGRNPMVLFAGGLLVTGCAVDKGPLPALVSVAAGRLSAATVGQQPSTYCRKLPLTSWPSASTATQTSCNVGLHGLDDTLISARWAKQVLQK